MSDLWELTLDRVRKTPTMQAPWGIDRARARRLLWELYLLGERASAAEIRSAAGVSGKPTAWSRALGDLWSERLRAPFRNVREVGGWAYPFVMPHLVVEEEGLTSIQDRLRNQLVAAVEAYAETLTQQGDVHSIGLRSTEMQMQARALRAWGETVAVLRIDTEVRGVLSFRPDPPIVKPRRS